MFLAGENRYAADQSNFSKIPGSPVAYWVSEKFIEAFEKGKINEYGFTKKGMFTGNNDFWLKLWYEINVNKIGNQFMPYNKGGEYRKWYGNNDYIINWGNDGKKIKEFKGSGNINEEFYFQSCITWNLITSSKESYRLICDDKHVMGDAGPTFIPNNNENRFYFLALLNSIIIEKANQILSLIHI